MRRSILTTVLALSSVALFAVACTAPTDTGDEHPQANGAALRGLDDQEAQFLTLINQYRASLGVAPLVATPLLDQIAFDHSQDMATNNYFDHNDQQGHTPFDRMTAAGYHGGYEAENIAAGNADAQATFDQWKGSAGHNANMIDAHYVAIGIGRAYAATATYGWYWTTDFGDVVDPSVHTPLDGGIDASDGAADSGAHPTDGGAPIGDAAPVDAAPPPPAPGCTSSGAPSQSYASATPLAGTYCASLSSAGESDWFAWSVGAAGVAYDLALAATGDANVAMWKLVNGKYVAVKNASPTKIAATSTAAGSYVVEVWSKTHAAQTYGLTLAE